MLDRPYVEYRALLDSLKQHQMDVVLALAAGRDVFAVLPTGYGKSLCYACLPVMFDRLDFVKSNHSIVVVITPLNAIIQDQVSFERKIKQQCKHSHT